MTSELAESCAVAAVAFEIDRDTRVPKDCSGGRSIESTIAITSSTDVADRDRRRLDTGRGGRGGRGGLMAAACAERNARVALAMTATAVSALWRSLARKEWQRYGLRSSLPRSTIPSDDVARSARSPQTTSASSESAKRLSPVSAEVTTISDAKTSKVTSCHEAAGGGDPGVKAHSLEPGQSRVLEVKAHLKQLVLPLGVGVAEGAHEGFTKGFCFRGAGWSG